MSKIAYGVVVFKAALADKGLSVDDLGSVVAGSSVMDDTEHAVTLGVADEAATDAAIQVLASKGLVLDKDVVAVAASVADWWFDYKEMAAVGMQHGS